jgi:hypothetical protein
LPQFLNFRIVRPRIIRRSLGVLGLEPNDNVRICDAIEPAESIQRGNLAGTAPSLTDRAHGPEPDFGAC